MEEDEEATNELGQMEGPTIDGPRNAEVTEDKKETGGARTAATATAAAAAEEEEEEEA